MSLFTQDIRAVEAVIKNAISGKPPTWGEILTLNNKIKADIATGVALVQSELDTIASYVDANTPQLQADIAEVAAVIGVMLPQSQPVLGPAVAGLDASIKLIDEYYTLRQSGQTVPTIVQKGIDALIQGNLAVALANQAVVAAPVAKAA